MAVLVELYEGHVLSLQFFLHIEMIIYGALLPVVVWVFLTLLARNMDQRARSEDSLERHQYLTRQLARSQEWDELTAFIVRFPGTFLPIEHVALLTYDHREAELEFVKDWRAPDAPVPARTGSPGATPFKPDQLIYRAGLFQTNSYEISGSPAGRGARRHFCLPLSYDGVLVGALHMESRPGQTLTADQIEFVNTCSAEIALALVLSIAEPWQMNRVRLEAQLGERRRIAHELHDALAQQMFYLHLSLDQLAGDVKSVKSEAVRHKLGQMRDVANEVYDQIRNSLATLRTWGHADLTQAIRGLGIVTAQRAGLELDLTTEGNPVSLSAHLCQQVFGLVQEGLANVEKHAAARHLNIQLHWSGEALSVTLADDGVGFNPADVSGERHFGLAMMRERVEALRGELHVVSAPGRGTRLELTVPSRAEPAAQNYVPPSLALQGKRD